MRCPVAEEAERANIESPGFGEWCFLGTIVRLDSNTPA